MWFPLLSWIEGLSEKHKDVTEVSIHSSQTSFRCYINGAVPFRNSFQTLIPATTPSIVGEVLLVGSRMLVGEVLLC